MSLLINLQSETVEQGSKA